MLPERSPCPEDLALWCQSRMEEGGIVPPHSVLAPGTALRLLPSRALSSAQAKVIVTVPEGDDLAEINREETRDHDSDPVVRSELLSGNLRSLPLGPTRVGPWMRRRQPAMAEASQHDALYGVALTARNSHQICPHLP
jgi:hypothetical protein